MKTVYLGDTDHPTTVSDSAFALIEELTLQNKVCRACQKPYTDDRPEVVENGCLGCFLETYESKQLSFLRAQERIEGEAKQFRFIDPQGYVYLTTASLRSQPKPSMYETLCEWGFSLPVSVTIREVTIFLKRYDWTIYGDFKTNAVVVLEYNQYTDALPFLSYKNGICVYLDKRKGDTRKRYLEAKKQLEASKGSDGVYRYKEYESYNLYPSILYPLIADLASEAYVKKNKE